MMHIIFQSLFYVKRCYISITLANCVIYSDETAVRSFIPQDKSGVVGWCDGAELTSSAGASYNLDYSRARAYCTCCRCRWGLFGTFYSHLSFLSSFSLFGRRPDID